uniref:DUF4794 domain-containing protein n=1 Tax=Anopheles epiroticus TaxID=199890 RepID=A0A182PKK1_9DIPT
MMRTALLFALVAMVVAEPPLRFRSRAAFGVQQRPNARFARLEEASPAPEQPAGGYHYPKPMSSDYHYPKPDQAFPLPGEEMPPAFTTEQAPSAETTTQEQEQPTSTESSDAMTTTVAYEEDYEDSTAALEPVAEPGTSAKLRRRQQLNAAIRPAPLAPLLARQRQRLEELPAVYVSEQEQTQLLQRPVYLINLPESALQQLVLLNSAQLAGLQVAPQPATPVYLSELDYIYKKK